MISSPRASSLPFPSRETPLLSRPYPVSSAALTSSCGTIFIHSLLIHPLVHPSSARSEWEGWTDNHLHFLYPSQPFWQPQFFSEPHLHPQTLYLPFLCMPNLLPFHFCKPFATAFSFLDSRELSFAPPSFPPPHLPHPFATPDPGVMIFFFFFNSDPPRF